ncbi:MAG: Bax inhibitor-1/YccA family protein [Deltaproteobacteria bacterium]|nr:MAG: Bax inhibitor-1/YccA family protein [Deltaproteobacteria bacterium]
MRNIYWWMSVGLALTALTAVWVAHSEAIAEVFFANPGLVIGTIVVELALVVVMTLGLNKLSARTLMLLFLGYAVLNGLTFSVVFLVYTAGSIASTFLVTGGTFAAMAVYGSVTKRDLSSWRSFLLMGLIGLILASVVNFFLHSEMLYWGITYAAVIVFVGLSAYDVQRLRRMAREGTLPVDKLYIFGALALYLDFINLFLYLLRFLGNRR